MPDNFYINLYLHLIGAAAWTGGMLFFSLVMLPSVKNHPDRIQLLTKAGLRFRMYGWAILILMLLTGIINMYIKGIPFSIQYFNSGTFARLLGIKLLLFIFLLIINLIHDFYAGKQALENADSKSLAVFARWSGRVNLVSSLIILYIGLVLSKGGT